MVKCKDCQKHQDKGNFCEELNAGLSFDPDTEVACPKFAPKGKLVPEEEAEEEEVGEGG